MTKAPRPGVGARRVEEQAAQVVVAITVGGETLRVAPFNLPLGEALAFRRATGGLSVESFWSGSTAIGRDSVRMLWWLARRANGEPTLTLEESWDEWPGDDSLSVEVEEPGDTNDPEV